jgi:predicted house-cleaning noncanonical NTP pyrophosphatase (MazG superfamily)
VIEKLVRDRIPELYGSSASGPGNRVAEPEEMLSLLVAKLYEEVDELAADPSLDELVDVTEEGSA